MAKVQGWSVSCTNALEAGTIVAEAANIRVMSSETKQRREPRRLSRLSWAVA